MMYCPDTAAFINLAVLEALSQAARHILVYRTAHEHQRCARHLFPKSTTVPAVQVCVHRGCSMEENENGIRPIAVAGVDTPLKPFSAFSGTAF